MQDEHVPKPGTAEIQQYENVDDIPRREITQSDLHESGDSPKGWLLYGNNYERHHYSTADVITPENVSNLSLEWQHETVPQAKQDAWFQGSVLVVPGDPPIVYQTNGTEQTRAMNARTGEILWFHQYHPKGIVSESEPPANRGVGILGDTVFKATLDHGVLALNRYDGSEKWYYNGAYEYRGETAEGSQQLAMHDELQTWSRNRSQASNYPIVPFEDAMIMGSCGGEWGVHGWADGVTTDGNREWRTGMTPPEEWVGDAWKHGGSTIWQAPAIDPESGLAVLPTGNPGPWFGTVRPGWNPYSAGKVAVDFGSGDVEWNYQESPHDWWDYDSPSPAIVYEAEVNGEARKLASWPGKTGWVYTVDAETGELVERSEEYVEHINTWTIPPQNMENAEWTAPHLLGGTDPQPSSFDPKRRTMFLKANNTPMKMAWSYTDYEMGEQYKGETFITAAQSQQGSIPEWENPPGNITALDPVTGEIKWQDWMDEAPWGGLLSTATGLTFAGTPSGEFVAYDSETGDRLWTEQVSPRLDGNPVTWVDPTTGKQYVYVQGGGGTEQNVIAVFSMEG